MQQSILRFPQAERLKSRKVIGRLATGDSISFIYPFRIAWMIQDSEEGYPLQIAFSVPKRRFKLAVERNPVRRRMMEAWRLHRQPLIDQLRSDGKSCSVVLIYSGKPEDAAYDSIVRSIKKVINGLIRKDLPPARPSPPRRTRSAQGH
ncbi:MAG: ribonuclease P protein component [Saprospiraceae bacterium]|nr:ribonuclease P protein component [Saprospiraceae bacterium]